MHRISWNSPAVLGPIGFLSLAGLLYVYSSIAVAAAKSDAKRLREQDGGRLDLHRQSLRQHGLLDDRDSVVESAAGTGAEEAVRAERKRRKDEATARELEEMKRIQRERNSLWNWVRGK